MQDRDRETRNRHKSVFIDVVSNGYVVYSRDHRSEWGPLAIAVARDYDDLGEVLEKVLEVPNS